MIRRLLGLDDRLPLRALVVLVLALLALAVVETARGAVDRPTRRQVARMSWLQAVQLVDRHLGHGAWLRSCSQHGSEGGWGRWFWNGGTPIDDRARRVLLVHRARPGRPAGSSGAGGWLQFLDSTFDSVIVDAVVHARQAGLDVPPLARSWLHPLGQAVAGVEMVRDGRVGEWAGWGC